MGLLLSWDLSEIKSKTLFRVTAQSLFEGAMIQQGCRKKSYSGSIHLTLGLTTSHGNNKESPMIVIITLTYKNIENPLGRSVPRMPRHEGEGKGHNMN
jgi:hypothetical protein